MDPDIHSEIKTRRHHKIIKKEEDVQLQQHLGRNPQTIRRAGQIDLGEGLFFFFFFLFLKILLTQEHITKVISYNKVYTHLHKNKIFTI